MKLKGKQDIEYWITRGRSGQIVRVYQIDQREVEFGDRDPFTVPILIDYMNQGESLVTILEERDALRQEVKQHKDRCTDEMWHSIRKLESGITKKWWQLWK